MDQEQVVEKLDTSESNSINQVVAVMSGKGGVGKSSMTAMLAVSLAREGLEVGILDADITGPSIPRVFGIKSRPQPAENGIYPVKSSGYGISIMSLNLLLQREDDPVIWRGPIIAGTVRQFWTDVIWGKLDYLLVDLPPGTGDAPLTVLQQLPLKGIVIVSSPQELAVMVVKKAVNMAARLSVPLLGLVENMSHAVCPACGERIDLFGEEKGSQDAEEMGIPYLGSIPIDTRLAALCDQGRIEDYESDKLGRIAAKIIKKGE